MRGSSWSSALWLTGCGPLDVRRRRGDRERRRPEHGERHELDHDHRRDHARSRIDRRSLSLSVALLSLSCRDPSVELECGPDDVETSAHPRTDGIACDPCDLGNDPQIWVELRTACEAGVTWEAIACGDLEERVLWRQLDGDAAGEISLPECLSEATETVMLEPGTALEQRIGFLTLIFGEPPPDGRYAFDIVLLYGFETAHFEATLTSR